MTVTLTITNDETLPANTLERFIEKSKERGRSPESLIAEFIRNTIESSEPKADKKEGEE